MDKIQIIEKLFYYINAYLYLILPLSYIFFKAKKGDSLILALYGTCCFLLLNSYYHIHDKLIDVYFFFYTFLEYSFFTLLIYLNIRNRNIKKVIVLLSVLFLIFQVVSYFEFKGNDLALDTVSVGIETILLFIYIIFMFFEFFNSARTTYIYNSHIFWICLGILIYLGGTFFFNILANDLSTTEMFQYITLTYFLEMIKTILFVVAMGLYSSHSKDQNIQKTHVPYLDLDMN